MGVLSVTVQIFHFSKQIVLKDKLNEVQITDIFLESFKYTFLFSAFDYLLKNSFYFKCYCFRIA